MQFLFGFAGGCFWGGGGLPFVVAAFLEKMVLDEDVFYCLGGKSEFHLWVDHRCSQE